jgi:hypothetical protein
MQPHIIIAIRHAEFGKAAVGYLGAAAGGVWLLLSIWKSRRADRE